MLGIFIISHTNNSVSSHSQHVIILLLIEIFLKVHKELKSITPKIHKECLVSAKGNIKKGSHRAQAEILLWSTQILKHYHTGQETTISFKGFPSVEALFNWTSMFFFKKRAEETEEEIIKIDHYPPKYWKFSFI